MDAALPEGWRLSSVGEVAEGVVEPGAGVVSTLCSGTVVGGDELVVSGSNLGADLISAAQKKNLASTYSYSK